MDRRRKNTATPGDHGNLIAPLKILCQHDFPCRSPPILIMRESISPEISQCEDQALKLITWIVTSNLLHIGRTFLHLVVALFCSFERRPEMDHLHTLFIGSLANRTLFVSAREMYM